MLTSTFISCDRIYLPPVVTNFESWSKRWRLWKINGTRATNRPRSLLSVGCFNWEHKSEVNDVTPLQQLSKSWHFTIQHGVRVRSHLLRPQIRTYTRDIDDVMMISWHHDDIDDIMMILMTSWWYHEEMHAGVTACWACRRCLVMLFLLSLKFNLQGKYRSTFHCNQQTVYWQQPHCMCCQKPHL